MDKPTWVEYEAEAVIEVDDFAEAYRGYDIYLSAPSGKIIGVSVVKDTKAWLCFSEVLMLNLYDDEDWHITEAKKFIDSKSGKKIDKHEAVARLKELDEQIGLIAELFDVFNPNEEDIYLKLHTAQYAIAEAVVSISLNSDCAKDKHCNQSH